MMKYLVVLVLSVCALFQVATCKPSPPAITRDSKVELPGSERINKRSPQDYLEIAEAIPSDIPSDDDDSQDGTDYSSDYAGSPVGVTQALESNEDFETAESSIIFHPLFSSRKRSVNKQRTTRSTGGIQENLKRGSRSLDRNEKEIEDELELAENGMVFLPLFRSRDRVSEKQRLRRSAEDAKTKSSSKVIETDDDLIGGGEDVIYKPVNKRGSRPVRSIEEVKSLRSDVGVLQGDGDMAAAENGLIFRPLFRNRQRDTRSAEFGYQ